MSCNDLHPEHDLAQLPALIDTLKAFHPLEGPAIRYAANVLREHQLLTPGTGGRGAAPMTVEDAVHLLLALNLAVAPSQYAEATEAGLALERQTNVHLKGKAPAVVEQVLRETHFGGALARLIETAEELALPGAFSDPVWPNRQDVTLDKKPAVDVEVLQIQDGFLARIEFRWMSTPRTGSAARVTFRSPRSIAEPVGRWRMVHFDEALFLALKRTVCADPPWVFAGSASRR